LLSPVVTVVNPRDWLDRGALPADPPRLRKQALSVAQCIEYGGPLPRGHARETLIPCRHKLEKKACPGLLWVLKQADDAILAYCQVCGHDEYLIYEWEDTEWAEGPMEPVDVEAMARQLGEETRQPCPGDRDVLLQRALEIAGSTLSVDRVKQLIQRNDQPSGVIEAILASIRGAPQQSALERLMPVLMDAWNSTPRHELGGRTPTEMATSARAPSGRGAPRVGRNDPCPCGSGRKYKHCCLRAASN
jgi:hypothetical protein